jgi:hypothetical protein
MALIIQLCLESLQNVLIFVLFGLMVFIGFIIIYIQIVKIFNKKQHEHNWGVGDDQASVLGELENRLKRPIPIVHEILSGNVGVKIEDGKVIGLGLYQCNLNTLPDSFGQLKSLQKLNLGANGLIDLPNSFNQLKSLQKLNLYSNKLQTLLDFFGDFGSLQKLDLRFNKLVSLPETILDLPLLKHIHVFGNPWNKVEVEEMWKKLREKGVKVHKFIF